MTLREGEILDALKAARNFVRGRHSTLTYGPRKLLNQLDNVIAALAQPVTPIEVNYRDGVTEHGVIINRKFRPLAAGKERSNEEAMTTKQETRYQIYLKGQPVAVWPDTYYYDEAQAQIGLEFAESEQPTLVGQLEVRPVGSGE